MQANSHRIQGDHLLLNEIVLVLLYEPKTIVWRSFPSFNCVTFWVNYFNSPNSLHDFGSIFCTSRVWSSTTARVVCYVSVCLLEFVLYTIESVFTLRLSLSLNLHAHTLSQLYNLFSLLCNPIQHLKQKGRHSSTRKGPLSPSREVLNISLWR